MVLRRVGGKSDGGIDLVGWWWLPSSTESNPTHCLGTLPDSDGLLRRRLRVIAQCKAEKKKLSPKYVREMEGVWHFQSRPFVSLAAHPSSTSAFHPSSFASEPVPTDLYPTVALLLSESPFSQSTILHVYRSAVPFLLIHLPSSASPSEPTAALTSADETQTCTVCPNPTLARLVKPLTFCWERHFSAGLPEDTSMSINGRPGLWWQGRKLGSWTPQFPDPDMA